MWTGGIPPPPNTTSYDYTGVGGYTLAEHECWYPCIGNTTANVLGVAIPELRGRMVMGQGVYDGQEGYAGGNHDMQPLLGMIGGEVPVGQHKHHIHHRTVRHRHHVGSGTTHHDGHNYERRSGGHFEISDRANTEPDRHVMNSDSDGHNVSGTSTNHNHEMEHPIDTRSNARADRFTKHTVPHSTILQFWIRVR